MKILNELFKSLGNNKDSFIIIGIFLTFLMSAFSLYFSIKNNKAVQYVNTITKSRIEWLENLRTTMSEFISKTNIFYNVYYKKDYVKSDIHLSRCKELASKLEMMLNCCDEKDKEIIEITNDILANYSDYLDDVHNCKTNAKGFFEETPTMQQNKNSVISGQQELMKKVQIYLKCEWNRVKYESTGKKYHATLQEFDYEEIRKKVDSSTYKVNHWKRFSLETRANVSDFFNSPKTILLLLILIIFIFAALYFHTNP